MAFLISGSDAMPLPINRFDSAGVRVNRACILCSPFWLWVGDIFQQIQIYYCFSTLLRPDWQVIWRQRDIFLKSFLHKSYDNTISMELNRKMGCGIKDHAYNLSIPSW